MQKLQYLLDNLFLSVYLPFSHSTSIKRSSSAHLLEHSDNPHDGLKHLVPFVINPTISSPGTGVQQRERRISKFSIPFTITPDSVVFFMVALSFLL